MPIRAKVCVFGRWLQPHLNHEPHFPISPVYFSSIGWHEQATSRPEDVLAHVWFSWRKFSNERGSELRFSLSWATSCRSKVGIGFGLLGLSVSILSSFFFLLWFFMLSLYFVFFLRELFLFVYLRYVYPMTTDGSLEDELFVCDEWISLCETINQPCSAVLLWPRNTD